MDNSKNTLIFADDMKSITLDQVHKIKFCGPHAKYEDGTSMPFNEQMAIISHYLHNKGTIYENTYKQKALELIEDIILGRIIK